MLDPAVLPFSPVLRRQNAAELASELEEVHVDLVPWLEEYSDADLEDLEEAIRLARLSGCWSVAAPGALVDLLLRRQILLEMAGGAPS